MKFRPPLPLVLVCVAMLGLVMRAGGQTSTPANLNDVSLEVAVLQTLHDLELAPAQLTRLSHLARASAAKGENRQAAKTSAEFATALKNLHAAYARGDDKQISECREKLDSLMEKQQPELDNAVTITEEAKGKAAEALKVLNVRQAGAFLATLELTDPGELLLSALEQVRELKNNKELEQEIASVAEEVAWLVHGLEENEASQNTKDKVTQLLQRAAKGKNDAGDGNERKSLEKEAGDLVKEADNTEVLGHILEHGMAEMLSNPRLHAAIGIQLRVAAKTATSKKAGIPSANPKK